MFDDDRTDRPAAVPASPDPDPLDLTEPTDDEPPSRQAARANRPLTIRALTRRQSVIATVAILSTALVGGLLFWNSARGPDATQPAGSNMAAGSGGPGPSPSADVSPSTGPAPSFEPISGISATPVAILTAQGALGAVVPLDAKFRLESTDETPAARLAAELEVEPKVELKVAKDGAAVILTPAKPLRAGTIYRFTLHGSTGELLDTWAFQAKQPLRIVGTLPETHSSGVPVETGIEFTFDQDGVEDGSSHVAIQPATPGRFEQHDRTLVFIPDRPLTPAALYSVIVRRGIRVEATGEATNVDTRIEFETTSETQTEDPRSFAFPEDVFESSTAERPHFALWSYEGSEAPVKATHVDVYRLGGLDAAIDAFRTIRARPDWTRWSAAGLVDVSHLQRVVSADLALNAYQAGFWVELPDRLTAGWYVVQDSDGTKPIQAVLQVTDVAAYLAVSDTKTVVWANDLATGGPIAAATASTEGVGFGRADAKGLLVATTPKRLLPVAGATCDRPCDPVVVVTAPDGRRAFMPVATGHDKLEGYGDVYWWVDADTENWTLLHTDRNRYRGGDTVNVWGLARDRDTGTAPSSVTLRLLADSSETSLAVASLTRHPDGNGAFAGSISLAGLPDGYYTLTMAVGKRVVRSVGLVVGPIAKPAYQLTVTTGHRVYIAGDTVKATVNARFFEGTPVPGVPLSIGGIGTGHATTDSLGTAVWRTVAKVDDVEQEEPSFASIGASPARAEEGDIAGGSAEFLIFPSSRTISVDGAIASGRVVANGAVHQVAVKRMESAIASGEPIWGLDPRGSAIRNASVTVTFIELVPVRTQIGTEYDFIEKKVVPIFETDVTERTTGTVKVVTSATGAWSASVPAPAVDHTYRIIATVRDAEGHTARMSTSASRTGDSPYSDGRETRLAPTAPGAHPDDTYGVGDRIDLQMTDSSVRQETGDGSRYLFFTAQRGIRSVAVQESRRYVTSFAASAVPNLSIAAVRFTGSAYVGTSWYDAQFRVGDRRLDVQIATDASRYQPGESVTLSVRTRTETGAPTSATVVLRAIDEKLFSIGAAEAEDPLGELYAGLPNGIIGTYLTHRPPAADGEGGDTTGGGGDDRDDFRDSVLFKAITTDASGRGSVTFGLSDDLTSWRVTAAAVTRRLQAGVGSVLVPVGLPFFVDASIAPEYLVADRPTIAVRTYGTGVSSGTPVTIRVTSSTLGFDSGTLAAHAYANIDVPLPALRLGKQTVTIEAKTGSGSTARTDRLVRTFSVVDTRLSHERTAYAELPSNRPFSGGDGFTTVVVADASGGRYLAMLTDLAAGGGARLDRALAADLATDLLEDRFGSDASGLAATFEPDRYQALDGGFALVPYASSDLELSALVAIVAPSSANRPRLEAYFRTIRDNLDETRERKNFALAGLAGLGESVLPAIRTSAASPDLTVRERLILGLGATRLGDAGTGRSILNDLVRESGEQSGTQARLRVGTTAAEITEATALAAALAAAVGDPLGERFWAYVDGNPAKDRIEVLPAIAFVTATLDRLPVQSSRFAWTVGGERHVVELGPGESFGVRLTSSQLATLSIEPLAGSLGVTTSWRDAVRPDAFTPDPDMRISRLVKPTSSIKSSDLVVVDLKVEFGAQAANGCRQVTELVPSGLTPIGAYSRWIDPEEEPEVDLSVIYPYDQTGSRVSFCVEPTSTQRSFTLRYVARVVTAGTYAWEPAIAQSGTSGTIANLTPATTLTIR